MNMNMNMNTNTLQYGARFIGSEASHANCGTWPASRALSRLAGGMLLAALGTALGQPVITIQPQSQTNALGTTATFTVEATGTPPLAYQWQTDTSGSWSDLVDRTNPVLVLTNVHAGDACDYLVIVTNVAGAVTSAPATLTVVVPPQVTSVKNVNPSVSLGASQSLLAQFSGTPPFHFQWFLNGSPLPDATNSRLAFASVQLTNLGNYTVVITNYAGAATSAPVALAADPTFTKITTDPVVANIAPYPGLSWGDYDNDGFIDLFVAYGTSGPDGGPATNFLYHNRGNGRFERVTNNPIVTDKSLCASGVWGDFNNDGNLDLFVPNVLPLPGSSKLINYLYRGLGGGAFARITNSLVLTNASRMGNGIWVDYDGDGYLDLFYFRWYGGAMRTNSLYHNEGNGSFTEAPPGPWQKNLNGYNAVAAWGDYDNDGRPDLVLADSGTNLVCHNDGNGTFSLVTNTLACNTDGILGMAWADYDNDGLLDLLALGDGHSGPHAPNSLLFHNDGNGRFHIVNLGPSDWSLAATWADYDNDGYLDLFIIQGLNNTSKQNLLYHNNGDGTFTKVTTGSLVNELGEYDGAACGSCAWADYDNDGFMDLVYGSSTGVHLYHNNGNTNNWLKLKLVGTVSNRSAIGAKARVKATIKGKTFWQLREISPGTGFAQDDPRPNFGLGDATNVDVVRVEWPSGMVQEFTNVPARQILTIVEPARLKALHGLTPNTFQVELSAWAGMRHDLFTSSDLQQWTLWQSITNVGLKTILVDTNATAAQRFYRVVTR